MNHALTSWKSTLAGLLTGVVMIVGGAIQNRQQNPSAPPITFGNLAPAIGIAILGAMSKDHDVTGGTKGQDDKK